MSEWISVEQELPPKELGVLIFGSFGYVDIGYMDYDEWYVSDDTFIIGQVTHWMYLPEHPGKPKEQSQ